MLNKLIIAILSIVLFPTAFISLSLATHYPILYGLIIGLAAGALALLGLAAKRKNMFRVLELTIMFSLIGISLLTAYKIFIPLLGSQITLSENYALEKSLPLLATVVALYIFYILVNYTTLSEYKQNLISRLEMILSGPPLLLTLAVAIILTTTILLAIHNVAVRYPDWQNFTNKFLERGFIPPLTILLFSWGLTLLLSKSFVLWREKRRMDESENSLLMNTYHKLINENKDTTAEVYLELIWKKSAEFYILPRYFNWAIPILGFVGTVFGISLASDGIQKIISEQHGLANLSNQLGDAIAPLGIAFDTTLIALSLSIVLTLLQTIMQRWENNLLTSYENRILNLDS